MKNFEKSCKKIKLEFLKPIKKRKNKRNYKMNDKNSYYNSENQNYKVNIKDIFKNIPVLIKRI